MAGGPQVPSDLAAKAIADLYREVARTIQDEINKAVASGKLNEANKLAETRTKIYSVLQAAEEQAKQSMTISIYSSYKGSRETAIKMLRQMGATVIKEGFNQADQRRLEILIENATSKISDITTIVGRRTDDIVRRVSLQQITATNSLTGKEKAAALEEALTRAGLTTTTEGGWRMINVGGRNFELGNYAEMVARTTPREAATEAMKAAIIDNNGDLATISSHSGSCDECANYDGNTYSLTGETPGYDTLDEEPPFHPNCGHVLTPAAIF